MSVREETPGDRAHLEAVAASFRLAGEFLSSLADPAQVKRVVDALGADDPIELRNLLDHVPRFPGKCLGLCGAIRTIVEGEERREVKLCMLKRDRTAAQRLLTARIYEKHFGSKHKVYEPPRRFQGVVTSEEIDVIWPSPYQDELDANGLVNCWKEKVSVPTWSLGPPSWECVDLCR